MILDVFDMIIILATLGLDVSIIHERENHLSLKLSLIFMSVIWCWKQSFFPMALIPIGSGLLVIKCIEIIMNPRKGYHPWLSFSCIVLFLNAGCYIIIRNLLFFLLLCLAGMIFVRLLKLFPYFALSRYVNDLPFSTIITLAHWTTFLLSELL